ncbi:MAG: hypothetical protein JWO38_786 [Gemmataceae bacterium]|nr:hypothetical protein [Gemmataceae bacterium]
MRPVGMNLAAVLLAVLTAKAQPPAGPTTPALPPASPAPPAADPKPDTHLAAWKQRTEKTSNFQSKFQLFRKDAVFGKEQKYTGSISYMKPNLIVLEIQNTDDGTDYEKYLCTGKAIYQYDGKARAITEFKLNPAQGAGENVALDFFSGMKAAAKQRFQIKLHNEDKCYVYIDIKPTIPKDRQDFEHIRFVLFGPVVEAPATQYLPAAMYMLKPNGDSEVWIFSRQLVDEPNVKEADFQFREIKGWQFKQAPPSPPVGG